MKLCNDSLSASSICNLVIQMLGNLIEVTCAFVSYFIQVFSRDDVRTKEYCIRLITRLNAVQ